MLNNLIGSDIEIFRKRYDEALQLQGIPCEYQHPILPTTNAQSEPVVDSYSIPIATNIFFEGSPKIKTFKRLGWVVENSQDLPILIHCSFNLPEVQKDSIFKFSGQYTNMPDRTFRVTEITYDIQAPDHLVCQVVPVYESQYVGRTKKEVETTFNKSENFIKQPLDYRGSYITSTTRHRRTGKPTNYLGNIVGNSKRNKMLSVNGSDIQLTRGDSAVFTVSITLDDGTKYKRVDGDKLIFTIKKSYNSEFKYVSNKIVGDTLLLEPEDTSGLDYGTYWYDIQLTTSEGGVYTVVGPARFIVREEVTF